jgi:hypothetical protein
MSITQKEIDAWLKTATSQSSKYATELKAYSDAKSKRESSIKASWGAINTAYNELNGLAGGDKVATDAKPVTNVTVGNKAVVTLNIVGISTASGSKPSVNGTKITIPKIFNPVSFPSWFPTLNGVILDRYWYERFSAYKTNNNWPAPNMSTLGIDINHTIYLSWAHQFLTSNDTWTYLDKFIKAVGASNASEATKLEAINGYASLKAQKDAVIKKYNTFLAHITTSKKAIDTAETTYQNALIKIIRKGSGGGSSTSSTTATSGVLPRVVSYADFIPPMYTLPADVEWNLPPHRASLPIQADLVMGREGVRADDNLRRGRFWFYADSQATFTQSSSTKTDKGRTASNGAKTKYGFQFLWNPQSFSTTVQLNDGMTPSSTQYWQTSLPVFPSGQQLDVEVVISRINDFASFGDLVSNKQQSAINYTYEDLVAAKDLGRIGRQTGAIAEAQADFTSAKDNLSDLLTSVANDAEIKQNYTYAGDRWAEKIKDLYQRGTLADIEYIYRTVNGDGWTRLGQVTSDIGFLMMNLVEIEIGPNRYLGYLNSLNINHEMFTPNMVPTHSIVRLSFVLMSSAKVAQEIKTK